MKSRERFRRIERDNEMASLGVFAMICLLVAGLIWMLV